MKNKPNIIFYFSDQQRWDTVNEQLTPNLMELAEDGTFFENNFTCQPVCGPARACLQTGNYATECKSYWNGVPLNSSIKPLAQYFNEAGYETAYIGKWHLASDRFPNSGIHCEKTAVPKERQGGYSYWRAADVLEFTSHGYDGYVFDENGKKIDFKGYRADCINDFALEFLDNRDESKPFFMFVSQLEPHHQNDRRRFEGFRETTEKYKDYPIPDDLSFLKGDYKEMFPDYLSAINRLDYNVGRLVQKLKEKGLYDDTVIIYTSDHGCHFKTRNAEYKRSCHESSIHTPLIIKGAPFEKGKREPKLTSLIDLPATLLSLASIDIPKSFSGYDLSSSDFKRENVFIQISESQCGRAIRTEKYKYSVRALGNGFLRHSAKVYFEDYLYDLENDPCEMHNLIKNKDYKKARFELSQILKKQMEAVSESVPVILPALAARKK